MLTTNAVYWLAGLLEGEGSFGFYGRSPRIQICMTDHDVMERARVLLDFKPMLFRRMPNQHSTRSAWQMTICGRRAAGWMMTLYPLMGARRQERIRKVLAEWRSRKALSRPTPLCGHPGRPHKARRMCRNCYCMWQQGRLRLELHLGLQ